jgi:hypothetical protein
MITRSDCRPGSDWGPERIPSAELIRNPSPTHQACLFVCLVNAANLVVLSGGGLQGVGSDTGQSRNSSQQGNDFLSKHNSHLDKKMKKGQAPIDSWRAHVIAMNANMQPFA